MDPHGKILFLSPYCISSCKQEELGMQIEKAMCCGWIQPSRSHFSSPVLFVPKPDATLRMCTDYYTVNAITVNNSYPLRHIEDLLNSMHCFCSFTKLDLAAAYQQIPIAIADRQKMAYTIKYNLYEWRVQLSGLANAHRQFMCTTNGILKPIKQ
jgi:hypothetical protein